MGPIVEDITYSYDVNGKVHTFYVKLLYDVIPVAVNISMSAAEVEVLHKTTETGPFTKAVNDLASSILKGSDTPESLSTAIEFFKKLDAMANPSDKPKSIESESINGTVVVDELSKLIPDLLNFSVYCPACTNASGNNQRSLSDMIQHLNDTHKWSFETQIPDWLESLDANLKIS